MKTGTASTIQNQATQKTEEPRQNRLSPEYEVFSVALGEGKSYKLVVDAGTDDPVVHAYRYGHHANAELTELLAEFTRPGDFVLDLGAHVGTFSLAAAASGCRVVAVDASPKHVDLLRQSVAENDFRRMRVVHAAMGETEGTVKFHVAGLWGMVAGPNMHASVVDGAPLVEVDAVIGDQLLEKLDWKRVDFIKMDIEGSEVAAIRGMKNLLARDDAPVIAFECNGVTLPHYGYDTSTLLAKIEAFGYRTYRIDEKHFIPVSSREFQPETYVDLIALRPRHEQRVASRISAPRSQAEVIARAVQEARKSHEVERGYIASALKSAGPEILGNPSIQEALNQLAVDPVASVRESAQWWHRLRTPSTVE